MTKFMQPPTSLGVACAGDATSCLDARSYYCSRGVCSDELIAVAAGACFDGVGDLLGIRSLRGRCCIDVVVPNGRDESCCGDCCDQYKCTTIGLSCTISHHDRRPDRGVYMYTIWHRLTSTHMHDRTSCRSHPACTESQQREAPVGVPSATFDRLVCIYPQYAPAPLLAV